MLSWIEIARANCNPLNLLVQLIVSCTDRACYFRIIAVIDYSVRCSYITERVGHYELMQSHLLRLTFAGSGHGVGRLYQSLRRYVVW